MPPAGTPSTHTSPATATAPLTIAVPPREPEPAGPVPIRNNHLSRLRQDDARGDSELIDDIWIWTSGLAIMA